ncbi:MAG: hypothetical protein JHC82_10535 [Stenotrophomonas sp.]|jgi:hypothetical protein|nr:hypothetical protein [Stenotrophomonas sp.]
MNTLHRFNPVLTGLALVLSASVDAATLFSPATAPDSLHGRAALALQMASQASPSAAPLWIDLAAASVNADTASLEFELQGQWLKATRVQGVRLADGTVTWSGTIAADTQEDEGSIDLVRTPEGVTGIIKRGDLYRIEPAGGRHHLLSLDTLLPALPRHAADHPAPSLLPSGKDIAAVRSKAPSAAGPSVIRVLAVTTTAIDKAQGARVRSLVQLGITEGNRTYVDSNIDAQMELAGYEAIAYGGTSMAQVLQYFRDPRTPGSKAVRALRDQAKADVIMLVMGNDYYCGVAPVGARSEDAFMVVRVECLAGNDTVPHELGHIIGSSHNPENGSGALYPYAYGRQVCNLGRGNWHSVMAYPCQNRSARAQKWTSPLVMHDGRPTGNAARFDNRRVMEENRERVAGFR